MKKKIYFITTALAALSVLSLSSCLKDPRYVNFGQGGTVLNFPTGGLGHFGADAVTDAGDTIVKQFAVEIASPTPPSANTDVTIAVDNSIIAAYVATNSSVDYQPMPDGSYVLSATKVTVPAGKRSATITVTFYKHLLDPSKSYMLPIKIVSGPAGAIVSGNFGIHYYHFIGNDFAGTYKWQYQRYNGFADSTSNGGVLQGSSFLFAAGHTATFSPVTPTEFQMFAGYIGGADTHYDVKFTKTVVGGVASYSNFTVTLVPADETALQAQNITITQEPVFFDPVTHKPSSATLAGPYDFATARKIFHFQWIVTTSAPRYLLDTYVP